MPEIKHQFTKGKMNKDLDERLVPNGEYRDAMNIQVSTSEDSDVGTVQNILGNREIKIKNGNSITSFQIPQPAVTIGAVSDEKIDTLYYLVWSPNTNYIFSYKRNDSVAIPIFVDFKNVLQFSSDTLVTGINIIDGMLFWTDNKTEPKKINIERCAQGTPDAVTQTLLINESQGLNVGTVNAPEVETKHITVIKRGPISSLKMRTEISRDPNLLYTGVITLTQPVINAANNASSFRGPVASSGSTNTTLRTNFIDITTLEDNNTFNIAIEEAIDSTGNLVSIGGINSSDGLTGWQTDPLLNQTSSPFNNIKVGTKIVFKPFDDDGSPPGLPVTDYVIKGVIEDLYPPPPSTVPTGVTLPTWQTNQNFVDSTTGGTIIKVKVLSIDGNPPVVDDGQTELKYVVDLFDDTEKLFEFKFPRFSYRYKYEDGEYSTFAPFTQVAFQPGAFDYHPRKGYNLGMTNRLVKANLYNLVDLKTPKDVVSIDVLFKDEPSPIIYVVDTIRPDDYAPNGGSNTWNSILNTNAAFVIEKETINSVVPSNQLLRPYDNVPRIALAQDITGSRIVYGNYIQNYNLNIGSSKYVPQFKVHTDRQYEETIFDTYLGLDVSTRLSESSKSIKSLREYQIGVVFGDAYGRETPVISNESGTERVGKDKADKYSRFTVGFNGSPPDNDDLKYYKIYVKETSGEYYNMAMDRFYDAEDGNIWLAFPSSDRNKIDIDTFLILKKGSDTDTLVTAAARYKVIAIENEAPDYIKTKRSLSNSVIHSGQRNIYGLGSGSLGAGPVQGRDAFEMNYQGFFGTTAMNLDEYRDGQLYIEWEDAQTKQRSDRYRIISIEHDFDERGNSGGSGITLGNAKYYVQLDRNLGDDVNFITNDPAGNSPTKIRTAITTNIYKYEVENSPKFDGRFFVKIYEDEVFKANIGKSFLEGLDFRVLNSRKIYYMHEDHIKMHTEDVGDFLVDGMATTAWDEIDYDIIRSSQELALWGFYTFREFAAHALFFRRYAKGFFNHNLGDEFGINLVQSYWNYVNWNEGDIKNKIGSNTFTIRPSKNWPFLAHLKPVANAGNYNDDPANNFIDSPIGVQYHGQHWAAKTNWDQEFGFGSKGNPDDNFDYENGEVVGSRSGCGHTHNFRFDQVTMANLAVSTTADVVNVQAMLERYAMPINFYDDPTDTQVWFVDNGPYAGTSYDGFDNLAWNNIGRYEDNATGWRSPWDNGNNTTNPNSNFTSSVQDIDMGLGFNTRTGDGVVDNESNGVHKMDIAFGGIMGANQDNDTTGFFNFGWQPGLNNTTNDYHESEFNFIQNLNVGVSFRWKEDPTETVYTIGGTNSNKKVFRHSTVKTGRDRSNQGSKDKDSRGIITSDAETGVVLSGTADNTYIEGSVGMSMAEALSFNFSSNWVLSNISPSYSGNWNPFTDGVIPNSTGANVTLALCDENGSTGTDTASGSNVSSDLKIFVNNLIDSAGNTLKVGMAFSSYTNTVSATQAVTDLGGTGVSNEFLAIRYIEPLPVSGTTTHYALYLGGYKTALKTQQEHQLAIGNNKPKNGENITFVQVGMNGYSDNSEFNINTMGHLNGRDIGAVTAVGYNLEFIEYIEPEEILSENPAIFETEPKEIKELDVYYEATSAIPISLNTANIQDAFPIGSFINGYDENSKVVGYGQVNGVAAVTLENVGALGASFVTTGTYPGGGPFYHFVRPDGLELNVAITSIFTNGNTVAIDPGLYNGNHRLTWHNCFSFGNGVESNRIRDNFNLPFITNGVKVSTTLEHDYEEEHRKYGLIYSGIYNSVSGVNNLNQFIAAEKITKDVNPIYGSIQKLHSRNSDLVTLCEDKVLKILANKDAVFNADGNTNLTATENVLGQTIPFSGEFGISTNPESFASENYRAYFTDKVRGKVLRLSMDGLTPISDAGMNDWFRDNLKITDIAIGSYDDKKDQYNLTLKGNGINTTITYKENIKGWVSFKSFTPENAISMANDYYTFNQGNLFIHHVDNADRNTFYNQFTESSISVVLNDNPGVIKAFNTLNYEGSQSKVDKFSVETKQLDFQPDTEYNDQEYYNLSDKLGWYVGDIVTDKETGYISEFLEKEGKWFNNINRDININLDKADTSDFTFQGIAQVSDVEIEKANPIVLDLPPETPSFEPVTNNTTDVNTDISTEITIDIKTDKPIVTETSTDIIDDTVVDETRLNRDESGVEAKQAEEKALEEAIQSRSIEEDSRVESASEEELELLRLKEQQRKINYRTRR